MKPYGSIPRKVNRRGIYMKKEFLHSLRYGQEHRPQNADHQITVNGIHDNGQRHLLASGNMPDHKHGNKHVKTEK